MRAKKNLIASYSFILINIFINLFVVRLSVQHFGEQIYAFIVLAFSFVTYVESFNLGVFLSNRTQIPMRGENASVYTLASVKFLSLISLFLLIVFGSVYFPFGDVLVSMITTESDVKTLELGKYLISTALVYGILKIPLSVVLSSFAGHDLVDIEKKYNALQQITKISALAITIYFDFSVLTYFLSFTIIGLFILVIANIHYYSRFISHKKKAFFKFSKKISPMFITRNSFKFFVFTMASVVVWSTDNLLVSIFFTPKMVSNYHINFSIYNAAFLFITAIAGALIANYGNLIRDGEIEKLNFRINLSIYTTFLIALSIALGGVLFSEQIINIWVGEGHFIGVKLVMAFAIFGLTLSFSSIVNTLLALFANSKTIMIMTISEAVLNLLLSVILLKSIGVIGIAYATAIAATITVAIPGCIILMKHFKNEVKIEIIPLTIQFLLCASVIFFSIQSTNLSVWGKITAFMIYFVTSILVTVVLKKEYITSYLKMVKK